MASTMASNSEKSWALLLPLTSLRAPNEQGSDHSFEEQLWQRLERNLHRLVETTIDTETERVANTSSSGGSVDESRS